jgi:hypothetical protein
VRSIELVLAKDTYLPHRWISGRPPTYPTQYAIHEPIRLAIVPTRDTATKSRSPRLTRNPPNTMVSSEGIGMHADSRTMRTNTAA